jgi:uncharacterized protein with ParB-like and HNH nuclease domain
MANTIESNKIHMKDVFKKWFRIPDYQRPYVWGIDQVSDLLDDISFAQQQNKDSEYFLGSIVLQTREIKTDNGEYIENDLLDGQQRLITLILLTAVIRDLSAKETRIQTCQESIFQQANPDDNIPERLRIVFDIREEVKDFINEYVKTKGGTEKIEELKIKAQTSKISSIKNMANAILVIRKYFEEEANATVDNFFPYLRNKVLMIYVASEKLEDAFRLFTIMNNRGLKLRNSDILKAENLRELSNGDDRIKYAKEWEDIENYFEDDFDVFFSHLRTILVKEKARLNLLDEFEKNIYNPKIYDKEKKSYKSIKPLLKKGKETFDFIIKHKKNYIEIFETDHYSKYSSYNLDNLLTVMKATLPADLWIPPVLKFYEEFAYTDFYKFITKLDNKFSYDWIAQYTPTTRIENINNILKAIEYSENVSELFNSDVFEIDTINLINILNGDIYGRRYARYILYKLDFLYSSGGEKFSNPKTISAEHILPQNPKDDSQWIKDFSDKERIDLTDKIGNLVLISRRKNSSQGRSDFELKKKKYFENNIELFRNSVRVLTKNSKWSPKELNANHIDVIAMIENHYRK